MQHNKYHDQWSAQKEGFISFDPEQLILGDARIPHAQLGIYLCQSDTCNMQDLGEVRGEGPL